MEECIAEIVEVGNIGGGGVMASIGPSNMEAFEECCVEKEVQTSLMYL